MGTTTDTAELTRVSHGEHDELWRAGRGQLHIEWNERGAVLMRFGGPGDARFATVVIRNFEARLARAERLVLLFDAWDMPSYDSALRTELTSWCLKRRAKIRKLHVAVKSKLVGMGVAVANVALGGMIQSHSDRESFEALVRENALGSFAKK